MNLRTVSLHEEAEVRVKAEAEAIIARVMLALQNEAKLPGSSLRKKQHGPNFQISEIDLICLSSSTHSLRSFYAPLLAHSTVSASRGNAPRACNPALSDARY